MLNPKLEKWGYLRETTELANSAGLDKDTGLHRTGLNAYLSVIFPDVNDWLHDKSVDTLPKELKCRKRPDYRSETLKLIIEFDGVPHYDEPKQILSDYNTKSLYEHYGYKVVRIPFFIQLTNFAVKQLFDVDVDEPLFNVNFPSFGINGITPAGVSVAGLYRMAREFIQFPDQYEINLKYLQSVGNEYLTGANLLSYIYDQIKSSNIDISDTDVVYNIC